MKLADYKRLTKLMMLTTSDNDNEALSALRSANAILRADSIDWNRVFARTVQVINEFEPAPADADPGEARRHQASEIEKAFATLERCDKFNDFITSLQDQWIKRRSLSEHQMEALFKNAREAEDRR